MFSEIYNGLLYAFGSEYFIFALLLVIIMIGLSLLGYELVIAFAFVSMPVLLFAWIGEATFGTMSWIIIILGYIAVIGLWKLFSR
jgi:hypothetical protein